MQDAEGECTEGKAVGAILVSIDLFFASMTTTVGDRCGRLASGGTRHLDQGV